MKYYTRSKKKRKKKIVTPIQNLRSNFKIENIKSSHCKEKKKISPANYTLKTSLVEPSEKEEQRHT